MDAWVGPAARKIALFSAEGGALLPLLLLAAFIGWMVVGPARAATDRGGSAASAPRASFAPTLVQSVEPQAAILIVPVASVDEAVQLLRSDGSLREWLGEPPRDIEVLGAPSREAAELLAVSLREDFGQFEVVRVIIGGNDNHYRGR